MKTKTLLFILLAGLFILPSERASSESLKDFPLYRTHEELFRGSALKELYGAKAIGVKKLGTGDKAVSIDSIIQQVKKVKVVVLKDFEKPEGAVRLDAFYEPGKRTVYVNGSRPIPRGQVRPLSAHEFLGALGYPDSDYQVSLGLHFIFMSAGGMNPVDLEPMTTEFYRGAKLLGLDPLDPKVDEWVQGSYSVFNPFISPMGISAAKLKVTLDQAFNRKFQTDPGPDGELINARGGEGADNGNGSNTGGGASGVGGGGSYAQVALKARMFEALRYDGAVDYHIGQNLASKLLLTDFGFLKNSNIDINAYVSEETLAEIVQLFKASLNEKK